MSVLQLQGLHQELPQDHHYTLELHYALEQVLDQTHICEFQCLVISGYTRETMTSIMILGDIKTQSSKREGYFLQNFSKKK